MTIRNSLFLAPIALATVFFISPAHANLVVNGGFEDGVSIVSPSGGTTSGGGSTALIGEDEGTITGWTVGPALNPSGFNVAATNKDSYYIAGPHSGDVSAVFPNTPEFNGYMSQAVVGVVGGSFYNIGFWASNQVGDVAENYMTVTWGGVTLSTSDGTYTGDTIGGSQSPLPGAIMVPQGWRYYEWTNVEAPSNNTVLMFTGGNTAAANLIDDVSVVPVPEISSFGVIFGLGLFALGTTVRVRRRSLAAC